jgi:hypothetical protein
MAHTIPIDLFALPKGHSISELDDIDALMRLKADRPPAHNVLYFHKKITGLDDDGGPPPPPPIPEKL